MLKWKHCAFFTIITTSVFLLSWPSGIFAIPSKNEICDYSKVKLNEIMPNPSGNDTDYEWIELFNGSEEDIDLTGCSLDGKNFGDVAVIEGESYLVVAKDLLDKDGDGLSFEERWGDGSGVWGDSEIEDFDVIELNISMKNSDDAVSLVCTDYENMFEWEEAESGRSFSLDENEKWTDEYLVTPGHSNEPKPVIVYPHEVLISEVYPSPNTNLDENEWIELFNLSEVDINLLSWQIEDNSKSQTFDENFIIEAGNYLVLESQELEITLNNGGEILTLYDPNGEVVDIFEYEKTSSGISNIRLLENGTFSMEVYQTKAITKGSQNEYVDPNDVFYGVEVLTIAEARSQKLGEKICIQGVITVETNLLGSKLFYIQDDTGGIQVYFYEESYWQNYKVGDKLKLFGELKEVKGESRIYINDPNGVLKVSSKNEVNRATLNTGNIDEESEGRLVVVTGEIVETSGKTFYVDDGSGEIKILIKSSTGIETPEKKRGQYAGIVGIVSQYGTDEEGNLSYRILPRYATDIIISDEPLNYEDVLAVTGQKVRLKFMLGITILGILMSDVKLKRSLL